MAMIPNTYTQRGVPSVSSPMWSLESGSGRLAANCVSGTTYEDAPEWTLNSMFIWRSAWVRLSLDSGVSSRFHTARDETAHVRLLRNPGPLEPRRDHRVPHVRHPRHQH